MTPLISGEIGEDLAFYLTESQQTPSAVGLNVLLDKDDKVEVAVVSCSKYYLNAKRKKSLVFNASEMPAISTLLESDDHIEALLKAIYGDEPYKRPSREEISFQCDCNEDALWMLSLASQKQIYRK